jgi:hypothetical protein
MKLLTVFFICLLSLGSFAQTDITPDIEKALRAGNSVELGKHFASNVDLTLPADEDMYAKDQAVKLVKRFFDGHKPSSFKVIHRGTSKLNDHFRIGELSTDNGEFRVTFFMKKNGSKFEISQFRIEEADED